MKKSRLLLFSILLLSSFVASGESYGKGPFSTKAAHTPYLIFMNLPGVSAKIEKSGYLKVSSSVYYSQDISVKSIEYDKAIKDFVVTKDRDFESIIVETGLWYSINRKLEAGVTFRGVGYYGGVLDNFTEGWHNLFLLPNGGRDYVEDNDIYLNIETNNGFDIKLDKPTFSFGDIDTWIKYNIYTSKYFSTAALGGFKIPSGQLSSVSGSGFPDFLTGLLADFFPVKYFSCYLQAAVVLPMQVMLPVVAKPYPSLNCIAAIEFSPIDFLSLVAQMNIKSSHISGDYTFTNNLNITGDYYGFPQTNLLVGFVLKVKNTRIQFYFEEDTFTNAGVDYTINISASHNIRIR